MDYEEIDVQRLRMASSGQCVDSQYASVRGDTDRETAAGSGDATASSLAVSHAGGPSLSTTQQEVDPPLYSTVIRRFLPE